MRDYYLDNCATTKPYDHVIDVMTDIYKNQWGNPSSYHNFGFRAKDVIDNAKKEMSEIFGIKEDELFFTSGGTESDNWAVKMGANAMRELFGRNTIICPEIEHHAISQSCDIMTRYGFNVKYVPTLPSGIIDLTALKQLLDDSVALICAMRVNNETGVLQPVTEIAKIAKNCGALFVCDAVQAVGHIDGCDIKSYGADIVTFSAHKFGGPQGIGGIYMAGYVRFIMSALIDGGGQQFGYRSGTEPIALIAGMNEALKIAHRHETDMLVVKSKEVDYLYNKLKEQQINTIFVTNGESVIPGILSISFKGISGDMLQIALNEENIYVSTGSACNSGEEGPSPVLFSMKVDNDYIMGTIRISFGEEVFDTNDLDYIAKKIAECVNRVLRMYEENFENVKNI